MTGAVGHGPFRARSGFNRRNQAMTWTKPKFETLELSSEVTSYRFTR
jgi:coenzyme PQQ precursor peptide PqqA